MLRITPSAATPINTNVHIAKSQASSGTVMPGAHIIPSQGKACATVGSTNAAISANVRIRVNARAFI
ncbi:MAG TPA: hypothetical protein VJ793_00635 [Anaerolineae bacterium]|nr:hypothetical protein [Anaerolineae bacterium]